MRITQTGNHTANMRLLIAAQYITDETCTYSGIKNAIRQLHCALDAIEEGQRSNYERYQVATEAANMRVLPFEAWIERQGGIYAKH